MKTAISLSKELFTEAERVSKQLGISRSRLFSLALQEYLNERVQQDITQRLDSIYHEQSNKLDPTITEMQRTSIQHEPW